MEYRMASDRDIDLLVRSRLETLRAVNGLEEDYRFSERFEEASRKYFLEGDQSTVLAMEGDQVVGCATMCFLELMPTFSHPEGQRAHLMNVYTDPARMVSMLIEEAWNRGATEISLDATESGRPLYRKLGFRDSDECMVLEKTE